MAKNPSSSSGPKRVTKIQHAFRGIREPLVDSPSSRVVVKIVSGTDGTASLGIVLSPLGLQSVKLSSTVFTNFIVAAPRLQWLYNNAQNFGMYRVTRAKLVFVGNTGSTTSGTLNMFGSADPADSDNINTAFVQGPNSRSYDLAQASSKELSIMVPVDTTWKKCSAILSSPSSTDSTVFIPYASVADLAFGVIQVQAVSAPASTNLGNLFLDYDVEFKDPMSLALNK